MPRRQQAAIDVSCEEVETAIHLPAIAKPVAQPVPLRVPKFSAKQWSQARLLAGQALVQAFLIP
jgi:hypothetical protein